MKQNGAWHARGITPFHDSDEWNTGLGQTRGMTPNCKQSHVHDSQSLDSLIREDASKHAGEKGRRVGTFYIAVLGYYDSEISARNSLMLASVLSEFIRMASIN